MASTADFILFLLAVLFPPAVAHIKTGTKDLLLNAILTCFLWVPGILHAWYLIVKYPDRHQRHVEAGEMSGPARSTAVTEQVTQSSAPEVVQASTPQVTQAPVPESTPGDVSAPVQVLRVQTPGWSKDKKVQHPQPHPPAYEN